MNLQLCVSQQENPPYTFRTTGTRVYTFEELLYYVYHNWRECLDDILCDGMIAWTAEIGLSYLAAKMKGLQKPLKIMGLVSLISYFDQDELSALNAELDKWERRREWEQLKERADFFANKGECKKAIPLYKRALEYNENAALLNNLAIQYMRLYSAREALSCLTRALLLESANFTILLNYIEAAILCGEYNKAAKGIKKANARDPSHPDIAFFTGLISFYQKDYPTALRYFERAIEASPEAYYICKAADVHINMRQYEKALLVLNKMERTAEYYTKEAEIYAAWGDTSRAITSLNFAVHTAPEPTAELYTRLAALLRQDYAANRAEIAIQKALALSPDDNMVRLENARIKKALGRTREYQGVLNEVLRGFREGYREG
ncbi:MAG: hypothetical protein FWG87_00205 [Defluviitaleaceae bacterium]|nr:hypothetical protein [Defluviitaleaceae bacterium]